MKINFLDIDQMFRLKEEDISSNKYPVSLDLTIFLEGLNPYKDLYNLTKIFGNNCIITPSKIPRKNSFDYTWYFEIEGENEVQEFKLVFTIRGKTFLYLSSDSEKNIFKFKDEFSRLISDSYNKDDLLKTLYLKEREYQRRIFGNQKNKSTLNVSSFIVFLSSYLEKAKKAYCNKWEKNLPEWLTSCREYEDQGTAPVETYSYLIKILALTGAALEFFTEIDVNRWRDSGVNDKWF